MSKEWKLFFVKFGIILIGVGLCYFLPFKGQPGKFDEKVLADTIPRMASSLKTISTMGVYHPALMTVDTMYGYELINDSTLGREYTVLVTVNSDPYGQLYKALRDSLEMVRLASIPSKEQVKRDAEWNTNWSGRTWAIKKQLVYFKKMVCFQECGRQDSATFYRGAWEEASRIREKYETNLWGPVPPDEPVNCCKP